MDSFPIHCVQNHHVRTICCCINNALLRQTEGMLPSMHHVLAFTCSWEQVCWHLCWQAPVAGGHAVSCQGRLSNCSCRWAPSTRPILRSAQEHQIFWCWCADSTAASRCWSLLWGSSTETGRSVKGKGTSPVSRCSSRSFGYLSASMYLRTLTDPTLQAGTAAATGRTRRMAVLTKGSWLTSWSCSRCFVLVCQNHTGTSLPKGVLCLQVSCRRRTLVRAFSLRHPHFLRK